MINRNKVPGIFRNFYFFIIWLADCAGGDNEFKPYTIPVDFYSFGVSCGQCSVIVPDPWFEKLNKSPSFEHDRLQKNNQSLSTNSRLACCIQVRPELNEMICVVGNNKPGDGEFFSGKDPYAFWNGF